MNQQKIKEQNEVIDLAVQHFGVERQLDKVIEEMSELSQALLKWKWRYENGVKIKDQKQLRLKLLDEFVDVSVTLRQLKRVMEFSQKDIDNLSELKITRLNNLIMSQKKSKNGRK